MSDDLDPPDLGPEPGWIVHPPAVTGRRNHSFVSGDPDGPRIRVRYYFDPVARARVGKVWFGPLAEGPPGHAHGGALAAVLDEVIGTNLWIGGKPVLAGTLQVVYRRPVPLGVVCRLVAREDGQEGRKVHASGAVVDAAGAVYAEATGIFVLMRPEVQAALDAEALLKGSATPEGFG